MRVMVMVKATKIHFDGSKRSVTDGPFAENEGAGGGLLGVASAVDGGGVEWAKRCPNPMPGLSDIEIRPFWEPEDFDPEIVAQVNAHREKTADAGK